MDSSSVRAARCADFSVRCPDDKEAPAVISLLPISDKLIIVDKHNKYLLKLFDAEGVYLSSAEMKHLTLGITHVDGDTFATCGDKVFLWTLREQTIVSQNEAYDVEHKSISIHYNGAFYGVLHRYDKVITVLDSKGRKERKIKNRLVMGKKYEYGFDIHVDRETNNIYTPCIGENSGLLCLSIEGAALWFIPLEGAGFSGITEIRGVLCVADFWKKCLHLMSKTGTFEGNLMGREDIGVEIPYCVYYHEPVQKLYISYSHETEMENTVIVYKLTWG